MASSDSKSAPTIPLDEIRPDALLAVGDREDLDRGVLAGLVANLNGSEDA